MALMASLVNGRTPGILKVSSFSSRVSRIAVDSSAPAAGELHVRLLKRASNMNRLLSLGAALPIVLGALSLSCNSELLPDVSATAPQFEQPKPNRYRQPTESSEVTLYDHDPNHLWNRLHQALHVRLTDMGNPYK